MRRLRNPTVNEILDESMPIPFSGCFVFERSANKDGYGRFKDNGVEQRAHRYVWAKVNGPIPEGMFICHTCDNPGCVNPHHLFLGTPKDNFIDMKKKGRHVPPPKGSAFQTGNKFSAHQKGEGHPNSKLNNSLVLRIRKSNETHKEIAKWAGISVDYVRDIKNKTRWKHI